MASLNKFMGMGNLTRDPEVKNLPSGQAVANMRMALNRSFKGANGEVKEEVTFIGVEVWGKQAESCGASLKKGSALFVEGRLKLKEWTGQDGQKKSVIEVVAERVQFLGPGRPAAGEDHKSDEAELPPPSTDEDIPF